MSATPDRAGLDVDVLTQAMLDAKIIQRAWTDQPGPPWPTVSPWAVANAIARAYAARLREDTGDIQHYTVVTDAEGYDVNDPRQA